MENVVDFRTREPRSAGASVPFAATAKRAAALKAARDARKTFHVADQERAALNLYLLLEKVQRSRGISKRVIADAAGLGGKRHTDSTKRLDPYTLPPNASTSRRSRLAKMPTKYFRFADAIAKLLKEAPAAYLCQIFEGCSFGTDTEFATDCEAHRWSRLASLLRQMAAAVIRRENVVQY